MKPVHVVVGILKVHKYWAFPECLSVPPGTCCYLLTKILSVKGQ